MPFDQQEFYVASPRSEPHVSDGVLAVLVKARKWLADPAHWCRGAFCRDASGTHAESMPHSEVAATCAWGALYIPSGSNLLVGHAGRAAEDVLAAEMNNCIPWFNDAPTTRHADVLDAYDRAIAARTAELTRLG